MITTEVLRNKRRVVVGLKGKLTCQLFLGTGSMAGLPVRAFIGRQCNSVIIHGGDGYHYHAREERSKRIRLQCRHYDIGCRATAKIDKESWELFHLEPHSLHPPDLLLEKDFEVRRSIIEAVEKDKFGLKLRFILNQIRLQHSAEVASRFPRARMHSAMYDARSKSYPCIPTTLLYLGVLLGMPNTRRLCETVDRQDFIFKGVVGCTQHKTVALVFVSGRMLQHLGKVDNIHADGTFKKRSKKPKMSQIFNLCTNFGGFVLPLVRVLMMRRTEVAYVEVLRYLKTLAPNFAPSRIHCDFERAEMNAFRIVFPLSRIVGCLWHYGVASSIHAGKLGLSPIAKEHEEVKSFIRCIAGVPLLPAHKSWTGVLEIWQEVVEAGWENELRQFFAYFEKEWKPRIAELSVYDVPERTNNVSESDNRTLASVIPQNRPNVWHLIGGFVQLEQLAFSDKLAIAKGKAPTSAKRWKAKLNDKRVKRLSGLIANEQISFAHFLHQASYVILAAVNHGLKLNNKHEDDSSDSD